MAVEVNWFAPDRRILHYVFSGRWTWDEFFVALAAGLEMQKQVTHMTCTINDMSHTAYLPDDYMERARSVNLTRPLNTGIAVYISSDYHFRAIHEILVRLYPEVMARYPLAPSLTDALAQIENWFAQYDAPA